MIDLLCPTKKLRLKVNSKPWIDSATISAIHRWDKLFKKYKKSGVETDISDQQKWLIRKLYLRKRNLFSRKNRKEC